MDVNNQGLNIPSNLQNLDVRDELLSTEVGSGVNCAYSLRDLTGNNLNCVRVRREPEDTTNAIDDEKIFPVQAVASREVEDWVNGKLETTLPLDVATGSVGYSLRKIKSSYSGNAVRIRRISDSVEVDVAFDSDDKVSSSSAVTNVAEQGGESGQTTATTLGGFLTESATYFDTTGASSNTVQGLALVAGSNLGTVTFNASDGFGGDASFTFTGYSTSSSFHDNFYWNKTFSTSEFLGTASSEKTVTIQAYVKRTNGNVGDSLIFREYATSNQLTFTDLPLNEWKLVTGSIPTTNASSSDHIQIGGTNGTTFKLSLVKYSVNLQDAFVHTWYDQAGSNDAVQATAGDQPKIADNGALLADGVNFDTDFLALNSALGATSAISISAVYKYDTTVGFGPIFDNRDSGNDGCALFMASTKLRFKFNATSADALVAESTTNFALGTGIHTGSNISLHKNALQNVSTSDSNTISVTSTPFIGRNFSGTNKLQGNIKELIVYNSDQSDNRFKIESNINNYYGLYNDGRDVTGDFVNSGNGSFLSSSITDDELNFDYDPADTSEFFGIQLANNVVDGDEIFISFNGTGGFNPLVLLRHTSPVGGNISGTKSGLDGDGFQSFKLTCNSTDANDSFLVFQTRANPSGSYNVTNLKISRIARNGFVETWYDQSGNNKHLSQASAGNQPKIVLNGGQDITDGLHFDNDQTLGQNTGGTPNQSSAFFTFVAKLDVATTRPTLAGGNADIAFNATPDVLFRANSSNTRTATSPDVNIIVGQQQLISLELTSLTPTVYVDDGSMTLADLTGNVGPTFKILGGDTGINSTYGLDGRMIEAIAFDGDKSADVSAIRLEQNNYYNIY